MALKCPLCGGLACNRYAIHDNNSLKIVCNEFHRSVNLDVNIAACSDEIEKRKRGNLVLEHCLRESNDISRTWRYIYDHTYETTDNDVPHLVNIANVRYPNSFSEKVDRILLNLYRIHSDYADVITKNTKLARAFFAETEKEENNIAFADVLNELGYLTAIGSGSAPCYNFGQKAKETPRSEIACLPD